MRTERVLRLAVAAAALIAATAGAHEAASARADFVPPAPGTYRLERIMQAPEGTVLDTSRKRGKLSAFTQGKITLLSLMYTSCSDEKGCPLAFYSLQLIQRDLEKAKSAHGRVRLVSLSFDPEHDTPTVLKQYAEKFEAKAGWLFLTGKKEAMALITRRLGQTSPDLESHEGQFILGNVPAAHWRKLRPNVPAAVIVTHLRQLAGQLPVD